MFELMVEETFNSAHYLKGYDGNCKNMHGHNFKVQMFVRGTELNEIGLLTDYKLLRQELKGELDLLDHRVLNDVFDVNPTSEWIAHFLFQRLKLRFKASVFLSKIVVWESDKASACYFE